MNFWQKLNKPFYALAPMADVTDVAFRKLITKYGKPDVMWTEFVSADGLALAPEAGKRKLLKDLEYSDEERPIVAQLFSSNPANMKKAAKLCADLGFDGIDINMGCPDKTIEKQKCGAAMIKNPALAREVIMAAKKGAPNLPISVKTRLGYNKDELETWLPFLLDCDLAAITIHCRTRKEMSKVPARWDRIKRAVEIRNESRKGTLIIGNGDALDLEDAKKKVEITACDGVMLGRAIFGNPWLFASLYSSKISITLLNEKLNVMVEHTKLFEDLLEGVKNFAIMKKHYKAYVKDFSGSAELRGKLMNAENVGDVKNIVETFLNQG